MAEGKTELENLAASVNTGQTFDSIETEQGKISEICGTRRNLYPTNQGCSNQLSSYLNRNLNFQASKLESLQISPNAVLTLTGSIMCSIIEFFKFTIDGQVEAEMPWVNNKPQQRHQKPPVWEIQRGSAVCRTVSAKLAHWRHRTTTSNVVGHAHP